MVAAICKEIANRSETLPTKDLSSIYFGGGTPSLLDAKELGQIFEAFAKYFNWSSEAEITLEANPDDITDQNLSAWKSVGINRLSIGIQSFDEADLLFMNRAHNSQEAMVCIDKALAAGFHSLTSDLIYGSPTTSDSTWQSNIEKMLSYDLPHVSAYCLTVEEGTALHHFVKNGKLQPVDQDRAAHHLEILMSEMSAAGYQHYEISNFAKPGMEAQHNTNYWLGKPYLGVGPGAHSFDGFDTRGWNVAHNAKYISALQSEDNSYHHKEMLTATDRYNEYILTGLRTMWGIDEGLLREKHAEIWTRMGTILSRLLGQGMLERTDQGYKLSTEGKFLADHVSMQLFVA